MTPDLPTWLLEQIAEDEDIIQTIKHGGCPMPRWAVSRARNPAWFVLHEDDDYTPFAYIKNGRWEERHITRWDPARVLAECEAKRRIIEGYRRPRPCRIDSPIPRPCIPSRRSRPRRRGRCSIPYSDRPGYREEWKP